VKPSLREIARATATHFGISVADLTGQSRIQHFAWPRQITMFLCYALADRSYPDIGKFLGGRDHTTVMHGCREVERAAFGTEVLADLMVIAAEISAAARARASREMDLVQELHAGRALVAVMPDVLACPAHSRRLFVSERSRRGPQRPRNALPSDLNPPSLARLMGARA
jgi:hypothetical protein